MPDWEAAAIQSRLARLQDSRAQNPHGHSKKQLLTESRNFKAHNEWSLELQLSPAFVWQLAATMVIVSWSGVIVSNLSMLAALILGAVVLTLFAAATWINNPL